MYFQVCKMEFEIIGETEDWILLAKDDKGAEFIGGK